MLTSSQWPGVLRFVSKHRTYVFVLMISYTLLSVFVTVFSHPLEKYFPMTPPPPSPRKLLPLNPPSPLEFPMIFCGGGGGMDIFWNHTFVFAISCLHHSFTSKPNFFMCLRVQRCKESQFYSRPFAQL